MNPKLFNHHHSKSADARRKFVTMSLLTITPRYDCLINIGSSFKREYTIYPNQPTLSMGPIESSSDAISFQEYIKYTKAAIITEPM